MTTEVSEAQLIIESLRRGIPPQRGVEKYSVGNEKLIEGIKKFHLSQIGICGKIRFISGSWGGGKTHFFRLLRQESFKENCAVSNVELSIDSAPLHKFEQVYYSIIRNIMTPNSSTYSYVDVTSFGKLIEETLSRLSGVTSPNTEGITYEQFEKASNILMSIKEIDIDFRKMVILYWKTYLADTMNIDVIEQIRGEILQWFAGEDTLSTFRKRFNISKIISRQNAKIMLQSLANFIKISGYKGLVILFDEAEQSYSIMRKSQLKDAHNNLLSLINNIECIPGLFLIYATTPDFYTDPKHGIVIYGALSGRIGQPENKEPNSLDIIWNLDALNPTLEDFQKTARKIRNIYLTAYSDSKDIISDESSTSKFIEQLFKKHPKFGTIRFWRVMVTALIKKYDAELNGDSIQSEEIYLDVIKSIRET